MNRIDKCFEELKKSGSKALITFITAGDPDMDTTVSTALSMFENGADIIELGVPFSDPIAEGVTIQKSSLRSLNGGTTLDKIFGAVDRIREKTDKPLILMMYLNTISFTAQRSFSHSVRKRVLTALSSPICPMRSVRRYFPMQSSTAYTTSILFHPLPMSA